MTHPVCFIVRVGASYIILRWATLFFSLFRVVGTIYYSTFSFNSNLFDVKMARKNISHHTNIYIYIYAFVFILCFPKCVCAIVYMCIRGEKNKRKKDMNTGNGTGII